MQRKNSLRRTRINQHRNNNIIISVLSPNPLFCLFPRASASVARRWPRHRTTWSARLPTEQRQFAPTGNPSTGNPTAPKLRLLVCLPKRTKMDKVLFLRVKQESATEATSKSLTCRKNGPNSYIMLRGVAYPSKLSYR